MKSPKPATDNSLNEHFALWQILSLIFCSGHFENGDR